MTALALSLSSGLVLAADQDQLQDQLQVQDQLQDKDQLQDQIYGSQLMTQQERNQYREKIRAATTAQEREKIRNEHHDAMKVRAKERGVIIPNEPPVVGMGSGGSGSTGGKKSGSSK